VRNFAIAFRDGQTVTVKANTSDDAKTQAKRQRAKELGAHEHDDPAILVTSVTEQDDAADTTRNAAATTAAPAGANSPAAIPQANGSDDAKAKEIADLRAKLAALEGGK